MNNIDKYLWNPVFRFVLQVKLDFVNKFGIQAVEYKDYPEGTFFEHWINMLDNQEYKDKIKWLELNSYGSFLLLRYANYADIYSADKDMTFEELWGMYDGFYQECRSIVIDCQKNQIVICPFKKFFNLNEVEETSEENIRQEIECAHNVEFTEKLDGSMQCVTFYNDDFFMTGSQAINRDKSWRLQDGYKMFSSQMNYVSMVRYYHDNTFIFEYISTKDAHVVKYNKEDEGLYLVGIRSNFTGFQYSYKVVCRIAEQFGVKTTKIYDKTLDEVIADTKTIKSDEHEGFVLNIDNYLVKIKGDDYVQLHRILSKISSVNVVIKSIADGTYDDLLAKIPIVHKERIEMIAYEIFRYVTYCTRKVQEYYDAAPKDDKKTFMIWVNHNVPIRFKSYVRNKYLGVDFNYLKSGSESSPKYIKMQDINIINAILEDEYDSI